MKSLCVHYFVRPADIAAPGGQCQHCGKSVWDELEHLEKTLNEVLVICKNSTSNKNRVIDIQAAIIRAIAADQELLQSGRRST